MAQDTSNPFVLPGFGQTGDAAANPLLAGLDMMRQAWQNLASGGRVDTPAMPPLTPEDLDRRIRELQTVQNWLQLNATMLASTIQGLEIQRSTLQTLQSFAGGAFPGAAGQSAATDSASETGQAYTQAANDWWNLVQQQFEHLRDATTASFDSMAQATADTAASDSRATQAKSPRATAAKTAKTTKTTKTGKTGGQSTTASAARKKRST